MEQNISLFLLVLFPFAGAVADYFCKKREILGIAVAAAEFLLALGNAALVLDGREFVYSQKYFMFSGLHLQMDAFRAVFLVLLTFMWLAAAVFSPEYMKHHEKKGRYYCFTFLTLGATAGVFLSADLLTTYLFFEIMSFTSYVWVAQEETKEALRAAETYLAVAVLGGMVMLMGIFLLYSQVQTLALGELREACGAAKNPEILLVSGCLMLFGFGAKAGMFPLHIWLPKSHPVAPAPASALLSGVLTKCGIFGIIIIVGSILDKNRTFGWILLSLGTVTMFLGALLGVFSVNLKRTFACSSVSQIGFILVGLGMMGLLAENAGAVHGVFLHMVNHSMIKLILFFLSGVVYQNLHTLDLTKIQGFGKGKPFFLAAYLSGALAISGIPLFSGYISKTLLHEAIIEGTKAGEAFPAVIKGIEWVFLVSGGMTVAYMLKIFVVLFLSKPSKEVKAQKGSYLTAPVKCLLAVPALLLPLLGLLPGQILMPLAVRAETFFYGQEGGMGVETIHFFSLENLKGAAISIAIGLLLYFCLVKAWLIQKEKGRKYYVNRIPGWMDLEELVYRPLFGRLLPLVCGAAMEFADKFMGMLGKAVYRVGYAISRILDKLFGTAAMLCSITVFAEKKPKPELFVKGRILYLAGRIMDFFVFLLNRTIRKKNPIRKSYVRRFAIGGEMVSKTARLVARSVSYGLMLSCIGLFLTLVYLLLIGR